MAQVYEAPVEVIRPLDPAVKRTKRRPRAYGLSLYPYQIEWLKTASQQCDTYRSRVIQRVLDAVINGEVTIPVPD